MQNHSKDSFPSDTKKNPKYRMKITLKSGKELHKIRGEENEMTENEYKIEARKESEQNNLELTDERKKIYDAAGAVR